MAEHDGFYYLSNLVAISVCVYIKASNGHDVESLKTKRVCFEPWGKFLKLGLVSAGKPFFFLALYHMVYNIAKSKKPHTIAGDKAMCITSDKNCSEKGSSKKAWISVIIE